MSSTQEEVQKELQDYLTAKGINNLFIKVVEELLLQKPDNPVQFIVDHLRENYPQQLLGGGGSGSGDVMSSVANDADDLGDLSSDYESEEDELAEMKPLKVIKRTRRRTAISAPSFNPQDFDASNKKVFDKKDEEKARIKDILSRNLLFKNCGPDQMESLVDAFQPMNFDDGGVIIAQGDPVGEHFYLLEEGAADVYVTSKGEEHKVLAYESGSGAAFGELSLMYNAPRAATVKAKGATKVWALDRTTFKMVVTGAAIAQRQKRAQFVENVSILESLTAKEKLGVADALRERHVNAHHCHHLLASQPQIV
jgi:cAMP-dependent protein kinase regulator